MAAAAIPLAELGLVAGEAAAPMALEAAGSSLAAAGSTLASGAGYVGAGLGATYGAVKHGAKVIGEVEKIGKTGMKIGTIANHAFSGHHKHKGEEKNDPGQMTL